MLHTEVYVEKNNLLKKRTHCTEHNRTKSCSDLLLLKQLCIAQISIGLSYIDYHL